MEGFDWRLRGNCADLDPDAMFPDGSTATAAAKRVCVGCQVRADCLLDALRGGVRDGVWGGLTPLERSHLADRIRTRGVAV